MDIWVPITLVAHIVDTFDPVVVHVAFVRGTVSVLVSNSHDGTYALFMLSHTHCYRKAQCHGPWALLVAFYF